MGESGLCRNTFAFLFRESDRDIEIERICLSVEIIFDRRCMSTVEGDENCKNEAGVGIKKLNKGRKSWALENILEGNNPSYPNWKLKRRLLSSGYMPQVCANCGYDEPRVTDNKVPLLLDYMDGNRRNHKYDNLRMLCYNCWFQINGDLFGKAMRNVKKDAWDYQYIHK